MEELLKLDKQLCFKIYAASRMITKNYKPLLDKLNLTYPQYLAMLVLWEEKEISVKELGKKLYLDSGTLTPLLKKLEGKELVKRVRDTKDERVVNILLTPAGEQLKQEAYDVPKKIIEGELVTIDEYHILMDIFKKMLDRNEK